MNYYKIAKEVSVDIESGVYDQFEKLKRRMEHISDKMLMYHYCNGTSADLSAGEMKTLEDNDYINNIYEPI